VTQAFFELFSTAGAVERVGWVLVHSLWQFAVVAAVAAAVTAVLHGLGPVVRHAILASGLVAMAVLPVVTWWAVDVTPTRSGLAVPAASASSAAQPALVSQSAAVSSVPAAVFDGRASAAGGRGFGIEAVRRALAPWLGWCVAAWLVGVGCCAVRPLVGWAAWRRLRAGGVAVPAEVGRMVDRACRRLGVARGVRALATSGIDVPAVAGWLSPVVLVPMALVTSLPAAQLEALIVHELAHVRRGDVLVNVLQAVLETLAFYHPAVWWLSGRLRVEREHCCDDLVLAATGGRAEYGRALVAVEMLRGRGAALACGAADGSLVSRIRRLVTGVDPRSSVWPLPAFAAAGLAGLVVAVSLTAPVQADDLPKDTNAITSLTPEQAKKLAAEFKGFVLFLNGLTALSPETATALAGFEGKRLDLNGLTTLSPETATALAGFKGDQLLLNGLTTLSPETAEALAGFRGDELLLDGLAALSPETARALAGFKVEDLSLAGLTTLSPEAATSLAGFKGEELFLNGLTTLSPETARALVEFKGKRLSLGGLTTLSPEAATSLDGFKGERLLLNGLTTLSPETATALAAIQSNFSLAGITALDSPDSVAVAEALAMRKGLLVLHSLKRISPKALSALLKKEDVKIPLIETLELIAEPDGSPTDDFVIPEGFKERQEAKRKELEQSRQQPRLQLRGDGGAPAAELPTDTNTITSLTPEQAKKLAAEFKGVEHRITLNVSRTTDITRTLPDALPLDGLKSLDLETARVLATYGDRRELTMSAPGRGALLLNGLATLDAESATALAGFKGYGLWLNGLKTLSPEAATALAGFKGRDLSLAGLNSLSLEAATALADYAGDIFFLPPLRADFAARYPWSPDNARALIRVASDREDLVTILEGLTELSPELATAIAESKASGLKFVGLTKLSPEAAAALAGFKGKALCLDDLTALSPEAATALAGFKGFVLTLGGLTTLDADAAKALAEFKGEVLSLRGLATLSPEAATSLDGFKGRSLILDGLTTLSPETATALAAIQSNFSLAGITALDSPDSVAVAEALAMRKGPLVLHSLRRISPKALSALLKKEDVMIPLIETLELIPEPDGSPTDDFVIPEGFKERQRRQRGE
jgi:beta-lactamase regulating signal transducer with metallopeptidase domain